MMKDKDKLRKHLKQMGKKTHVIDDLLNEISYFESWLNLKAEKALEQATKEDLLEFAGTLDERETKIYMRALALFYHWIGNDELKELTHCMREKETAKTRRVFNLREFQGVDPNEVSKLETLGIATIEEMISAGKTPQKRKELAERSGVTIELILELVKLSDLTRLPGVKGIRARINQNP